MIVSHGWNTDETRIKKGWKMELLHKDVTEQIS